MQSVTEDILQTNISVSNAFQMYMIMQYISPHITYLLTYFAVAQFIENNWQTGRHSIQRIVCRSEASKGVYCLQYDDQKIVSGLRDNTIKVSVSVMPKFCLAAHDVFSVSVML